MQEYKKKTLEGKKGEKARALLSVAKSFTKVAQLDLLCKLQRGAAGVNWSGCRRGLR